MQFRSAHFIDVLPLLFLFSGCTGSDQPHPTPLVATGSQPVVYGEDNRMDYYAHPDEELRRLTRESIVALIPPDSLDMSDPDDIQVNAPTLGEYYYLCSDQRFVDQPTAASCSGTLIDDDLVLTAGHCVVSDSDCRRNRYVFNYFYEDEGRLATITSDDVYECEQLVVHRYTSSVDYAILQLDRQVTPPHRPAAVKLYHEALSVGDSVPIIGFGSGLPAKIDDGGNVLDGRPTTLDYFVATTDTFGGNSGSGVFDTDLEVVGILVRGETDYVYRDDCRVVNELDEDSGLGEDITYAYQAIEALCEDEDWPSTRLCSGGTGDGWCAPCESIDDCPERWSCSTRPGVPEVTWCAAPCTGPDDCIQGHFCSDSGLCQPEIEERCFQGDVWTFDTCGNPLWISVDCTDEELCVEGECVNRPPGDVCPSATPIEAVDQTLTGNLASGYLDDYQGSCGGVGAERVFEFTLEDARRLTAQSTGFDTLLYLRSACEETGSELACNDDSNPPGDWGSRLVVNLTAGTYYLFMDAYNTTVGTYDLLLTFTDPGQIADGDTCSNATEIEAVSQTLTGDLSADYTGTTRGSCAGSGVERIYQFSLSGPHQFVAEASGFDTVLYLRSVCTDSASQIVCNDDATPPGDWGSHIEATLAAGSYYLFMDSYGTSVGSYTLDVSFEPLCLDECVPGARECIGDGFRVCEIDAEGCAVWSDLQACPDGTVCLEGECVDPCVDPCDVDSRRCTSDSTGYQVCVDAEPCPYWGARVVCPPGQICEDGACVPICEDECEVGARQCVDGGYRVCVVGEEGCAIWGAASRCQANEICQDGYCLHICIDECDLGSRQCYSQWAYQDCVVGVEGCTEWGSPAACPEYQSCQAGQCVPICENECVLGSRRCVEDWGYQVCEQRGPCTLWGEVQGCLDGEFCQDGQCIAVCRDECVLGDRRCVGEDNWQECLFDEMGCARWGNAQLCAEGEFCDDGFCGTACTNHCSLGDRECAGDSDYRSCGDFDEDACLEWSGSVTCGEGRVCTGDGLCTIECPHDGHEPNNTLDEAVALQETGVWSLVVCEADDDWFAFEIPSGWQLEVTVEFDATRGNVDLELYDQDETTMLDASASPTADWEQVRYATDSVATVYWRLFLQSGEIAEYRMDLNLEPISEDLCTPRSRRCTADGRGFQKCILHPTDPVWVWSDVELCGLDAICLQDGVCQAANLDRGDMGFDLPDTDNLPDLSIEGQDYDLSTDDGSAVGGPDESGCGCQTAHTTTPGFALILAGTVWLVRRRQRIPAS